ncbi:MAG: type II secretion system F family protein [Hydrogenibacillus schlegelii]|uniref:Type II secretion system F family protein n=1 Tax=Hydrogenibacillus schlegelii TaxID=1484 RepID=A0A947GGK5_HYDSH|nr:type II secretion system F family protein [Hydrogenibacillus schlegelii]
MLAAYVYTARDLRGRRIRGRVEAAGPREAFETLRGQGLIVLRLHPDRAGALRREIYLTPPVKGKEFVFFARQLSVLIRAGVPVIRAFELMAAETTNRRFRAILAAVRDDLRAGRTLNEALAAHPAFFPRFFIAMVRAGEAAGALDETLLRAADVYERQLETREELKSALTYPTIVAIVAVLAVAFLLGFVVPRFTALYADLNVPLPAITVALIRASGFFAATWPAWIAGAVLLTAAFIAWRRTPGGGRTWDALRLRIPIYGAVAQKGSMALFSRAMSTFYTAAVPVLEALTLTQDIVRNRAIAEALEAAKNELREGRSFSQALRGRRYIPPLVVQMIAVGEETGALDDVLNKMASFYEMEVRHTAARVKALIEPILIVGLAALVGTIMLAVLLPMLTLYQNIG